MKAKLIQIAMIPLSIAGNKVKLPFSASLLSHVSVCIINCATYGFLLSDAADI